jgi:flagellar transcriptional activator FlhD
VIVLINTLIQVIGQCLQVLVGRQKRVTFPLSRIVMSRPDTDTLDSIQSVNLSYIVLAQNMLRENRAAAMFRLGLSAQLADLLNSLTLAQAIRLADSDELICAFRFDDAKALSALTDSPSQNDMARTHAALLLAGMPAHQFA